MEFVKSLGEKGLFCEKKPVRSPKYWNIVSDFGSIMARTKPTPIKSAQKGNSGRKSGRERRRASTRGATESKQSIKRRLRFHSQSNENRSSSKKKSKTKGMNCRFSCTIVSGWKNLRLRLLISSGNANPQDPKLETTPRDIHSIRVHGIFNVLVTDIQHYWHSLI